VGCRQRDDQSRLLRVVAAPESAGAGGPPVVLVPDPARRMPGRGASVHLATACFDLAERRRAFARALRIQGPVDTAAVRHYIEVRVARQPE